MSLLPDVPPALLCDECGARGEFWSRSRPGAAAVWLCRPCHLAEHAPPPPPPPAAAGVCSECGGPLTRGPAGGDSVSGGQRKHDGGHLRCPACAERPTSHQRAHARDEMDRMVGS